MTVAPNFFDQFASPSLLYTPLLLVSLLVPWLLLPVPSPRWINNRLVTLQNWLLGRLTSQLLLPIDPAGHKWAVLLSSLLVFLLYINMMGLLPYTFTPTTQLSMNMGFAVPLWLATVLIGFRGQPTAALGHLLPEGAPMAMAPPLVVIETISLFIRPLALGVRLTANLTAGHLMMQLIATGAFVMLFNMPAVAALTMGVLAILTLLESAVAVIQAYVFVLLVSLYLQDNL